MARKPLPRLADVTRLQRLLDWFGTDDAWQRPRPRLGWPDLAVALVAFLVSALAVEAVRSMDGLPGGDHNPGIVWQYVVLATGSVLLAFRRRHPIATMVVMSLHFFVTCTWVPGVGYSFVYQIMPFLALYSGVAWARNRREVLVAVVGIGLGFTVWLTWLFAMGRGLESFAGGSGAKGLFSGFTGAVLYTVICNVIYYFAALLMGAVAWHQTRDHAEALEHAETISRQTDAIAEHAVVEERLRLARELHDVVAHHIAVTGVQAAAARRVLDKDAQLAGQALSNVEQSSRDAVTQMRSLLGTLRSPREESGDRAPEPSLGELGALVEAIRSPGFDVDLQVVEETPGNLERVPAATGLALYRTVQEALANVRRHSTARAATVVVRVGQEWVEVEVTDDGRPRQGTSGSGFGQQGMRERVTTLGGELEVGPRPDGGYRVRARLPLEARVTSSVAG